VRYASPVLQFARFVTEDTEINGQPVGTGDKVGLFYCSAIATRASSTTPTPSTCSAHPIRTSASEAAVRTSASATNSPEQSCETCSASC